MQFKVISILTLATLAAANPIRRNEPVTSCAVRTHQFLAFVMYVCTIKPLGFE